MDKIKRREFVGNWIIFWVLGISVIGIPFAILYLIENTIEIEYEVENGEKFMDSYVRGRKFF